MVLLDNSRNSISTDLPGDSVAAVPHPLTQNSRMTDRRGEDKTTSDIFPIGTPVSLAEPCPLHDGIRELNRPVRGERHGWPHLAKIMSDVPEFAAFSRFRELNVRNLLYYQAELKVLEEQICIHEEQRNLDVGCYEDLAEDANSCYHELMVTNRRLLREYSMTPLSRKHVHLLTLHRRSVASLHKHLSSTRP